MNNLEQRIYKYSAILFMVMLTFLSSQIYSDVRSLSIAMPLIENKIDSLVKTQESMEVKIENVNKLALNNKEKIIVLQNIKSY